MSDNKDEWLKRLGFSDGSRVVRESVSQHDFSKPSQDSAKKPIKRYYLGDAFCGTYLTLREAETMTHLLLGKTIRDTAISMQLSPRTAEFYINNIKRKLKCRTKKELINKIMTCNFLKKTDLVGSRD